MATKYQPLVDPELLRAIIGAEKGVRKALKNEPITFTNMTRIIRAWQSQLRTLRKKQESERIIRNAEIILGFIKSMHKENMAKYESYRKGDPQFANRQRNPYIHHFW